MIALPLLRDCSSHGYYRFFLKSAKKYVRYHTKRLHEESHRNEVSDYMEKEDCIVKFSEDLSKPMYIKPSNVKSDMVLIDKKGLLRKEVFKYKVLNSEKHVLSNSEIIDRFTNNMTSVHGGRLCDKCTAPQYTQMIQTIIKSLSNDENDFATLCARYNIRDRFIA